MIIGLTGPRCAGKKTVLEYLAISHGFKLLTYESLAEEAIKGDNMTITVPNVSDYVRRMKQQLGPGALADMLLNGVMTEWRLHYVVLLYDSAEIAVFRKRPFFFLLAVDAPVSHRFDRYKSDHADDSHSLEEFVRIDDQELYGPQHDIRYCVSMADRLLFNVGSKDDLFEKLRSLDVTSTEHIRPLWDTYFMRLAELASQRSNCMKRRVGAIIVRERRVISTGYNGTPKGSVNCNDGGCPRCNSNAKEGERLDECLCMHAEANAIIEAGRERAQAGTIYCTAFPCIQCTKQIIQSGVTEVVYAREYAPDSLSSTLLHQCGVRTRKHSGTVGALPMNQF